MVLESNYHSYKFNYDFKTDLPSHWLEKRLGYLAKEERAAFVDGPFGSDLKSSDYKDSGVPLIQLNNIRDSKHLMQQMKFINEEKKQQLIRHLAIPGDVVIAKMADPVARSAVVVDHFPEYIIVADCVKMTPNLDLVDLNYLVWAINCDYVRINAELVSTGTTRIRINLGELKKLKIPYPPYVEQQKIANFLDHETAKIDTLIEKQQQLIKLLKEKRQAVISHAVTKGLNPNAPMRDSGVEWLGEVPEHWGVVKLSYRYEVLLGKMLDDKKITGDYLGAYLRNTDVQWDRINTENLPQMDFRPEEYQRYSVKKGDLISCEGGEIGRSAIWEHEETCFYQKALHRLRPHDYSRDHARFMFYTMFDAVYQERFSGGVAKATIAHLPAETFRQYRFAYPPYDEQVEITAFLDEMKCKFDAIESSAQRQIDLLKERRTALISAAVTGKIDVRNWQVPVMVSTT